jgi:integrase
VSIRKLPNGKYEWRHRVAGRHLKKTFDRRADAVVHDSRIRADLARGVHVDLSNRVTVAEYFRQWIDARVIRPNTVILYTGMLRNHVEPTPLGSRPLVKVRPSDVQTWVQERAQVLGPRSVHSVVSILRSAFGTALLDGLIARNPVLPAGRLSLPKHDRAKIVPLTAEQVYAWADCADPRVRAMILAQAGLGLRISELRALRVSDVDWLPRKVRVTGQLDRVGERAPLKTANSRRVVPLPQPTLDALAAHIAQFPPGPDGLIFTNQHGRPWRGGGSWLWTLYHDAAVAAWLPEGTSSHDLRHRYASVLLAGGLSVPEVAERLGDTAQMVLRTYGHVMPDQEDIALRILDADLGTGRGDSAQSTR